MPPPRHLRSVYRCIFKPDVAGVPNLLLPHEHARHGTIALCLRDFTVPPELVEIILEHVVYDTPQLGLDPLAVFRWFWAQGTRFQGHSENPVRTVARLWQHKNDEERFGADLIGYLDDDQPVAWTDLADVMGCSAICGSAMAHRVIGTSKWYPNDWDILMSYYRRHMLFFERWLESTFTKVEFLTVPGTKWIDRAWETGRSIANDKAFKWKVSGGIVLNMIYTTPHVVRQFDFEPASTVSVYPFDTVYQSFDKQGPYIMHRCDRQMVYDAIFSRRHVTIQFTQEDLAKAAPGMIDKLVERNADRAAMYASRSGDKYTEKYTTPLQRTFWYGSITICPTYRDGDIQQVHDALLRFIQNSDV